MPNISHASATKLVTCHPLLKKLTWAVVEEVATCVVYGHRTQIEQDKCYANGTSKLKWPESRHNFMPSKAIDLAPLLPDGTIPWNDREAFFEFAEVVKRKAAELGIEVVWGGDWPHFPDLPHWELKEGA